MRFLRQIKFSADELVGALLSLSSDRNLCLLDSCGRAFRGSNLLIAGIDPVKILEISKKTTEQSFAIMEDFLAGDNFCIATLSYDFGNRIENIHSCLPTRNPTEIVPEIAICLFDTLIIHDYSTFESYLVGNNELKLDVIETELQIAVSKNFRVDHQHGKNTKVTSNFTRQTYCQAVEEIKEQIIAGQVYQVNLTQQFTAKLPQDFTPEQIFLNLRSENQVPFSAFIRRKNDVVISASPERFLKVFKNPDSEFRIIEASPIKGTRKRGKNPAEDSSLFNELKTSMKDRAENVMIVDLLRNDLGKICKFGSVEVTNLCEIEANPTVFHLVSTIQGQLRENISIADILKATFPCGSITGAPKIRSMQIISEIEEIPRGLSMGAIGYICPKPVLGLANLDLSVAIRTMVINGNKVVFNVGGGVVIDSNPEEEYEESMNKAAALFRAINADLPNC